jgi:uncharacterized protein
MKVVLAGGSGALGRRLAAALADDGSDVVVLTRTPRGGRPHRQLRWDGATVGPWATELTGAVLINLAGELVDRRPTRANVALLRDSRVAPTQALARAAAGLDVPPALWVQLSTLALHGDAGETELDETAPPADGPPQMAGVARAWEAAAVDAAADRQVLLRAAVVLDRGTPALDRLVAITRWGLGGRVGDGRQWVSWLHIADLVGIVRRCIEDPSLSGPIVAAAPEPVRNAELMAELRRALGRPAIAPPTPAALVRVGAVALRTDPALALTGRRACPRRLLGVGYRFAARSRTCSADRGGRLRSPGWSLSPAGQVANCQAAAVNAMATTAMRSGREGRRRP